MAGPEIKKPAGGGTATTGDDWQTFALEYDEDRKKLRWAIGIAVALHVILFLIHLPEIVRGDLKPAEKPKVYVVQQIRFKPPPPQQQQQELLKPRAKKVPIPDPTPDEPEPIRIIEEVQQEIDIPIDDSVIGIPEGPPPSEPEGPIQVGGDVRPPEKISAPQPQYTEIARKARIQGVVIVQAIIDKQGNVTNVKVLKGLPMGLEEAAVDAIKQWKFRPATLNGKPVTVYYNLTVNFKLQ
ncbi:MAG: energy transducer TonB [Acidobacteria bacterium]|nr:energy transducer TonB [Acidobacteriota bacterium]MCB9377919.1 energy transducer TonB [Holophagales bacterium]